MLQDRNVVEGMSASIETMKKAILAMEADLARLTKTSLNEGTAADAGLSCNEVTRIVLSTIYARHGVAQMRDLYPYVEYAVNQRGWTLSFNGRASLRRLVNETAVANEYIAPHDPSRPGWRITPKGRNFLSN